MNSTWNRPQPKIWTNWPERHTGSLRAVKAHWDQISAGYKGIQTAFWVQGFPRRTLYSGRISNCLWVNQFLLTKKCPKIANRRKETCSRMFMAELFITEKKNRNIQIPLVGERINWLIHTREDYSIAEMNERPISARLYIKTIKWWVGKSKCKKTDIPRSHLCTLCKF